MSAKSDLLKVLFTDIGKITNLKGWPSQKCEFQSFAFQKVPGDLNIVLGACFSGKCGES